MNYRHVLISLVLAIPSLAFAEVKCDYTPTAQKYWNTQLSSLATHGKKALLAGDYVDVKLVLAVAEAALRLTCLSEPPKDIVALDHAMATVDVQAMLLDAAKLIGKSEYRRAQEKLDGIADYAAEHGVNTPDEQPVLLRTANEAIVTQYFVRLDKATSDGKVTGADALKYEKDACTRSIPALNISTPERCKKYK